AQSGRDRRVRQAERGREGGGGEGVGHVVRGGATEAERQLGDRDERDVRLVAAPAGQLARGRDEPHLAARGAVPAELRVVRAAREPHDGGRQLGGRQVEQRG